MHGVRIVQSLHARCMHHTNISYIGLHGRCSLPYCRLKAIVVRCTVLGACNCILPSTTYFCILLCP